MREYLRFVAIQIALLSASIAICFAVVGRFSEAIESKLSLNLGEYLPRHASSFVGHVGLSPLLRAAFNDQRTIVVLGTCELDSESIVRSITHNFLPDYLGAPLTALGHGGMRPLLMAIQVAAFAGKSRSPRGKLLIILSPDWFRASEQPIPVGSLLEFVPTDVLTEFYDNSLPNAEAIAINGAHERSVDQVLQSDLTMRKLRLRVATYLASGIREIRSPSIVIRALASEAGVGIFWMLPDALVRSLVWLSNGLPTKYLHSLEAFLVANRFAPVNAPPRLSAPRNLDVDLSTQLGWNRLFDEQRHIYAAQVNPFGFLDDQWRSIFSKQGPWPKTIEEPELDGKEFADLVLLVETLKSIGVQSLFVIQGINPKAYVNLGVYSSLAMKIETTIASYGFPVLNLWRQDLSEPGQFWGPLQTGDVGWMMINRFVYDHFLKE